MEDKFMFVIAIIIIAAMIIAAIFFHLTPIGIEIWEDYVESRNQDDGVNKDAKNAAFEATSQVYLAGCLIDIDNCI